MATGFAGLAFLHGRCHHLGGVFILTDFFLAARDYQLPLDLWFCASLIAFHLLALGSLLPCRPNYIDLDIPMKYRGCA